MCECIDLQASWFYILKFSGFIIVSKTCWPISLQLHQIGDLLYISKLWEQEIRGSEVRIVWGDGSNRLLWWDNRVRCIVMVHDPIACVPGLRVMTAHSVAVVFCRILWPIHDEPVYQCWRRQATWCWCWTSPVAPSIWSRRRLSLGYLICFQVISVHLGFISSDTYVMKIALFLAHSWRSVQIECKLTSDHLSACMPVKPGL